MRTISCASDFPGSYAKYARSTQTAGAGIRKIDYARSQRSAAAHVQIACKGRTADGNAISIEVVREGGSWVEGGYLFRGARGRVTRAG
jgi:hypothetical protein